MTDRRRLLGLVLVACLLAGGGVIAWRSFAPRPRRMNVVLVLVDTLRADHLSSFGYERGTSPNIDRFFAGAALFRHARSQASCTYPSVNSILTSRYPSNFLDQPEKRMGIPASIPSLAEILKKQGYSTLALSASPIVRKTGTKYNNFGGFDAGFDVFDEHCMWREARCMNDVLPSYLDKAGEPFFAYIHYIDPHDPYRPPAWFHKPYGADYEGPDYITIGNPNPIADAIQWNKLMPEYQPRDLQHLVDLYDDEINCFDGEFATLMGELGSRGLLDHTIVIFVSDHGEQFLEHGYMKHCYTLFDTDIHTPLAFFIPGVAPVEVDTPVQNLDVVPTVLDYLGVDGSSFGFEGGSLRPLIDHGDPEGSDDPASYSFALQGVLRSVTDSHFKLRYNAKRHEFGLSDLEKDPAEIYDFLPENPADFLRLQRVLQQWEKHIADGRTSDEMVRVGEEVQERLRALGYLTSQGAPK